MKELSMEEKAKRYDEAIEVIRKCETDKYGCIIGIKPSDIFPELKENEDEKMKKIISDILLIDSDDIREILDSNGVLMQDIDAWLEKQGEQKPTIIIPKFRVGDEIKTSNEESLTITKIDEKGYWSEDLFICGFEDSAKWELVGKLVDKVEPKFKNGQWIVWKDKCYKVNYNGCGYELIDQNGLSTSLEYGTIDEGAHLWTIQDAKDGDVLVGGEQLFLFKKMDTSNSFYAHCNYHFIGYDCLSVYDCSYSIDNIYPATEEQREILFQKMKEAGYEWDAEKKELKKIEDDPENSKRQVISEMTDLVKDYIEQKPADNVIEEEKLLLEKFKQAVYDCAWGKVTCKKEGETKEEYANRWAEHFLIIVRDWADDYIDFTIQQKLRNSYKNGRIDIIEKQGEHVNFRNKIQIGDKVTRNKDGVLVNLSQLNRVAKKQGKSNMGISEATKKELEDNLNKALEKETAESYNEFLDGQKSADKVEPKFKVGDIIRPKDGGHEPWQVMQVDISDKKYRFKDSYVIHFSQEDNYELVRQTPAWSEEDEERIKNILSVLDIQLCWDDATGKKGNPYQKEIEWLKSLKGRYTWKPSDKQMNALDSTLQYNRVSRNSYEHLNSLYNDLKKLKE